MNDLFEVAQEVQNFAIKQEWTFCFIGGLAVQHWGEPRVTLDVDLTLLTGFGNEEEATNRARDIKMTSEISLRLCSAEDLIVMKAFADRPRDWIDVEGVITRQSSIELDWAYIEDRLAPLAKAKESPEILRRLQKLK